MRTGHREPVIPAIQRLLGEASRFGGAATPAADVKVQALGILLTSRRGALAGHGAGDRHSRYTGQAREGMMGRP